MILSAMTRMLRPGRFLWVAAAVVIVIAISSGIYTVPADAEAIVMRFGKISHTAMPGLHFKIPFGIDRKKIVPVKRQLKLEFGFSTPGRTNDYQAASYDEQRKERSMITGDRNAATVEWVVQYRIDKPTDYLFRVRNPEDTLRDSSESVMREVVGDRTVDEVITIGRQQIEDESLVKLQELVNHYGLGFKIDQVQLKNVNPPAPVQASFNEVNEAQQDREKLINVARGEYNKAVPKAKGEADQKIAEAEGNAAKRVNEAEGDANRFLALYGEYEKFPAITRQRLYLERMQEVLPTMKRKIVVDEGATGVLPLLHLEANDSPLAPRR
ncbi:MAG: FtsH protease activity modulator HflK [Akkermansiaceae bacterium]|nr:FtsH protease activity modulator HflK [Akkermansiaceae bacterium]NNM30812.1 FtsH protease activity modulator HflK [Akkermansiaceae bacterium]